MGGIEKEQIREILNTRGFSGNFLDTWEIFQTSDNKYYAKRVNNALLVFPLSPQTKRIFNYNAFHRIYVGEDLQAIVVRFPKPVSTDLLNQKYKFNEALQERLKLLKAAADNGEIVIRDTITLTYNQFAKINLKLSVSTKKKDDKEYPKTKTNLIYKSIIQPQEKCKLIQNVRLDWNTILIIKNKSLDHYLKAGTEQLYTDSIIGYILERSHLLDPEIFKLKNVPKQAQIKASCLLKLYPHSTFKLKLPEGVEMKNSRPNAKRISKKDTVTFVFSDSFLNKYRDIIRKSNIDGEETMSFIRVPIFFILQALGQENLGANGFQFLLYILSMYRMQTPRITYKISNLLDKLGMDTTHGYKRPLERLNQYFQYLYKIKVISEPVKYTIKNLDEQPKYANGVLLALKTPRISKEND